MFPKNSSGNEFNSITIAKKLCAKIMNILKLTILFATMPILCHLCNTGDN